MSCTNEEIVKYLFKRKFHWLTLDRYRRWWSRYITETGISRALESRSSSRPFFTTNHSGSPVRGHTVYGRPPRRCPMGDGHA